MPDRLVTLPLSQLDFAPWNPKRRLSRAARAGLDASLDHFGLRDDLKVWPDPKRPGRFVVLNGNQRLSLLRERGVESVECRILDDLSPEDAKLFTASFDRSFARYEDSKLADLAAGLKETSAALVDTLLRVNRVAAEPRADAEAESGADAQPTSPADPDSPWGPAPDDPDPDPAPPSAPLIPAMFALSAEGYAEMSAGLLRSRARIVRARRLLESLGGLADEGDGGPTDEEVVEVALRVHQARRGVARVGG